MNSAGNDIERDDLVYSVNEPDNYAVEEALRIVEHAGGNVTVVTVGGDDDEEILRRELAMGAKHGVLLSDDAFSGSDGRGIAAMQAGINEPRYVGMRDIRQVASVPIPTFGAADLGVDGGPTGATAARVNRVDYFVPPLGQGAEMLEGSTGEIVDKLIELLRAKGGLN